MLSNEIFVRRSGQAVTCIRVQADSHQAAMKKLWAAINDTTDPYLWQFYLHSSFVDTKDGWWEGRRRA